MKVSPDLANGAGGALADPPGLVIALDRSGPLHHGGRLRAAASHYGLDLDQWLDLSTGMNPNGWPVPSVPASAWARLPEEEDGLEQAARAIVGVGHQHGVLPELDLV